jgi:type II secretory pathway component PulF
VVGIAIAYETFFADKVLTEISSVTNSELNFFSKFIKEFSNDMPFFYGLFSIMFAVILGIGAAFIRRFFSNLKKKLLMKS